MKVISSQIESALKNNCSMKGDRVTIPVVFLRKEEMLVMKRSEYSYDLSLKENQRSCVGYMGNKRQESHVKDI